MPSLYESLGPKERRWRWTRFRFEVGRWVFFWSPDNGLSFRMWEWGDERENITPADFEEAWREYKCGS